MVAQGETEGQGGVLRADICPAVEELLLQEVELLVGVSWQSCRRWLGQCRTKTAELAHQRMSQPLLNL